MSFDSQRANLTKNLLCLQWRRRAPIQKSTWLSAERRIENRKWHLVLSAHFPLLGLLCNVFVESASLEKDSRRLEKQSLWTGAKVNGTWEYSFSTNVPEFNQRGPT